jgi:phosphoadenosine phosphosulfate reductase
MPEQSKRWREYLIDFAKSLGKYNPEEYVDSGGWKARQGGKGIASSGDVIIKFKNCTAEENARIYSLNKPISESFYNLFVPFGDLSTSLGKKLLNEVLVLDVTTKNPIISIQRFAQQGYEYPVKIKVINVSEQQAEKMHRQISYQIKKFNACRKCLKCESICTSNAVKINANLYWINPEKCVKCKQCVNPKLLASGCHMEKFLKTKKESYED